MKKMTKISRTLCFAVAASIASSALPVNLIGASNVYAQELKSTSELVKEKQGEELKKVLEGEGIKIQSNYEVIREAIKAYQKEIDLSGNVEKATQLLADKITEGNISANDLKSYMKVRLGEESEGFRALDKAIQNALKAVKVQDKDLSEQELGTITAAVINQVGTDGLAWSGCNGLTAGVLVAIAAVTVGIIALVKTEGAASIEKRFNRKMRDRREQYERELEYIENRPQSIAQEIQQIQNDIADLNNAIDGYVSDRSYWEGRLDAAIESGDNEAAQYANNQIKSLNQSIENTRNTIDRLQGDISALNLEAAQYQDEAFVQNLMNQAHQDYQSDTAGLQQRMEDKIDLVPVNKQRAKTLGIIAGIGAAVGVYFIIDGKNDC